MIGNRACKGKDVIIMYDLTIELQNHSDKCLYEQIYEHIRQEIREGKLLCGERLPSTRSLADYLQMAVM